MKDSEYYEDLCGLLEFIRDCHSKGIDRIDKSLFVEHGGRHWHLIKMFLLSNGYISETKVKVLGLQKYDVEPKVKNDPTLKINCSWTEWHEDLLRDCEKQKEILEAEEKKRNLEYKKLKHDVNYGIAGFWISLFATVVSLAHAVLSLLGLS